MEIRELRAFAAVAEEGGFSAAARRLHLSQSALSQTIQALERQLGVQLLRRHSTGVTLTDVGMTLLSEARTMLAQHDRVLAEVSRQTVGPAALRVGVPLELPGDLLPHALAEVGAAFPQTRVEISHAASSAQLNALALGELEVALVRECPVDPGYDAVLAVEEPLGVLLATRAADELADQRAAVQLHRLAELDWAGFSRAESPAWYDQVTATLRSHGIQVPVRTQSGDQGLIAEVKLAAVSTGKAFAFAAPGWPVALPDGVTWRPLAGNPVIRRTWAVWPASARRRDLAVLVAALDLVPG